MSESTARPFKAEVSQLLKLLVNSLYSNKEVFVRELVSNASDALDKLRFESLSHPLWMPEGTTLTVRLIADAEANTLTIWDNGVGMSAEDLDENLGTLAKSGTRQFTEALEAAQKGGDQPQLIGQFGVGFYSSFLVADSVEVISRAAGTDEAHRWESDAQTSFTIEPAEREVQGTTIILHLKEECKEYLQDYRLRQLVERYSDYIPHAIELPKQKAPPAEKEEGEEAQADESKAEAADEKTEQEFEQVNQASALWRRSPKELTEEQYEGFCKHLGHDWEAPLGYRHFHVEGTQMFYALLFIPKRVPFDLFDAEAKHGVRLHVKRVFVMEDCSDLIPRYLRFMRGVVDSEDLPLNVSREVLQDSTAVRVIKKQVINHSLTLLEEMQKEDTDKYNQFWGSYGTVLKEGLHFGETERERVSKLVQYESSTTEGWSRLEQYVSRMKEGQTSIYYAAGPSRQQLENSPHLEQLRKRGLEVLYMTDPIDPFAASALAKFDDKPLVNAMTEELKLDEAGESKGEDSEKDEPELDRKSLLEHMTSVLGDKVSEVRVSKRMTDSPVCLVIPEGGMAPHIEQMLRARNMDVPESKRILEVNTGHPVVENLHLAFAASKDSDDVKSWILTLFDQALIAEGSPVEDPADFARRLTSLVEKATAQTSAAAGA